MGHKYTRPEVIQVDCKGLVVENEYYLEMSVPG